MCHPVTCSVCGKTTWAGCGSHIESVRRSVPASQWCPGHEDEKGRGGFFSTLFSR